MVPSSTRPDGGSRASSCWLRRQPTGELLAGEAIHPQLSSKASNLQPHIFLSEGVLVGCGVSEVEANQLVERPFQVDVLRQIRQRLSRRMSAKVPRELIPVLSDARSRWGMLANERGCDVRHELRTDQPHRGGKPFDQRAGQARHIVALMNRESLCGTAPSQQYGRHGRTVAVDERGTNARLNVSERTHADPLSRLRGCDRP